MRLSSLIDQLVSAMTRAGNVVVEDVHGVEYSIKEGVHRVTLVRSPPQEAAASGKVD